MAATRNNGIDGTTLEWNLRAWARRLHGALAARLALAAAVMAGLAGCDSMSFTPPRPTELSTSPVAGPVAPASPPSPSPSAASASAGSPVAPGARTRLVELILSQPPKVDRLWLIQFLRRDCGIKKCGFRATNPESQTPMSAAELAQAIWKASDRMTGSLIVEPLDDPEVRKALIEAGSEGLPIVLLDTPLPS